MRALVTYTWCELRDDPVILACKACALPYNTYRHFASGKRPVPQPDKQKKQRKLRSDVKIPPDLLGEIRRKIARWNHGWDLSPRIFRVWVGVNSGRDSGRFSGCFRALSGFSGPFPGFPGPFRVLSGSTQKGPGKGPENPERARKTRKGPGEPGGGAHNNKNQVLHQ